MNAAVTTAINRRHTEIKAEDILTAEKQYSQYVFESVNIENTLPDINLENVLFEFVGVFPTLTKDEVEKALLSAGIPAARLETTIDVLQDLTFLGLEIEEGEFAFSYSPEESYKNRKLAWRFAAEKGREERFQIHKAFQAFLETK